MVIKKKKQEEKIVIIDITDYLAGLKSSGMEQLQKEFSDMSKERQNHLDPYHDLGGVIDFFGGRK